MKRFHDILRKSPATYLCAFLILLAGCLLASCGTTFCKTPYNVGVKKAFVQCCDLDGRKKGTLTDPHYTHFTGGLELYRIGSDYYEKCDFIYAPVINMEYGWIYYFGGGGEAPSLKKEKWEHATYFCRLTEDEYECYDVCKPLPQTGTHGPDLLTEQEAQALNPDLLKRLDVTGFRAKLAFEQLPVRYSWPHYALLPVAGATAIVVDRPCSIIGTIAFGITNGILNIFN